ncbi:glycosyltransferase [Cyanobacterium aponinum]|uniref:glycosyltransferase n=1 Tax=Cyanobacterium aponinum TaxID=379064 RepID=UPI001F4D9796|nr:glycosyltransferase [Cyanobacterium aponinum]
MMKILMTIPAIGSVYGGTSKIVLELAKRVAKQGITVDLVTTTANGETELDVRKCQWIEYDDLKIQYFPYISWGDYKYSFSLTKWLDKNVKNYDIIHTNAVFSLPNIPAYWACQKHHIPYVITPHGMLEPWALAYKAFKKKIFYHLLEKPAMNKASGIQATASLEKDNIKTLNLKAPIFFIPNGIYAEDFISLPSTSLFLEKFPETKNRQLILFLGRIDPKKGLDLLAPAFAKINQQFPDTHLVIAGPDNVGYLPTVKNYFQELGCLDQVTFTGMLTGEMKYSALASASIYIAPSYSEGFSMSILEGMASGLPCIFTTACNFPEAKEAQAAKVVEVNVEEITEALSLCLSHPQEAKEMGLRAREFILNNYTWDKIAGSLISVYQEIISKKNQNV